MKLRNAWLLALALFSGAACATEDVGNWYFGLGVSSFNHKRLDIGNHLYETNGYVAKLGYSLGQYLAVEGHLGSGMGDKSSYDTAGLRLDTRYVAGIYARVNLPLDKVKLYAMGGYTSVNLGAELDGVGTDTETLSGMGYGFGVELYGNQTTALSLEYMRYLRGETYTDAVMGLDNEFYVRTISLGIVHHF